MACGTCESQHAKKGPIPYAASLAPDQTTHRGSLVRSNLVGVKVTQGFVIEVVDKVVPDQIELTGAMFEAYGIRSIFA